MKRFASCAIVLGAGSLRNSGLGLLGGWGQVLLAQWDSPYKVSTLRFDPTGNVGIAAYTGIMSGTGSVTSGQGGSNFAARASFDRRVSNVVQYWTPAWSGLSARFAWGTGDSEVGSLASGVSEASGLRPALYAGSVMYDAARCTRRPPTSDITISKR